MGTQKPDRIKRTMGILLVVCVVMLMTAAAVSAQGNNGQSDDNRDQVKQSISKLKADFTASQRVFKYNENKDLYLYDRSSGNPTKWIYMIYKEANPRVRSHRVKNPIIPAGYFEEPGKYNIWLTVENKAGYDYEIKRNYITVLPPTSTQTVNN